ncbi:unnamed protein product [Closterium sp. Naga37s-1]|nr:unnamed protein product [Closterium sp. Naga37s-1]
MNEFSTFCLHSHSKLCPANMSPTQWHLWLHRRSCFPFVLLLGLLVSIILLFPLASASTPRPPPPAAHDSPFKVCIVGAGIGGASAAFFLRNVSRALESAVQPSFPEMDIHVFERAGRVGGRTLLLKVPLGEQAEGDVVKVEAGASIIHGKNLHLVRLAEQLRLETASPADMDFGIWAGQCPSSSGGGGGSNSGASGCSGGGFVFQEWRLGEGAVMSWLADLVNGARMAVRYTLAGLIAMRAFVGDMLARWMRLYDERREGGEAFETPEELLRSLGLLELTSVTLSDALLEKGLPAVLVNELVTMITRVQYGQNATISGLPGAVGLCGTGSELWKVRGGNWQLAQGAIRLANASLHLHSRVARIAQHTESAGGGYVLHMQAKEGKQGKAAGGERRGEGGGDGAGGSGASDGADGADGAGGDEGVRCDAVIIATPMEQNGIAIHPAPAVLPLRTYQHTHVTFVRATLKHTYFGAADAPSLPGLIGTLENEGIPFSSISRVAPWAADGSSVFKVFSRQHLPDATLDVLFRNRSFTRSIDWPAYPHYAPPDAFAPFLLDAHHLYYTSTFESAASALETAAVAAKNVAHLLLTRLQKQQQKQELPLGRGGSGYVESMGLASPVEGADRMKDEL